MLQEGALSPSNCLPFPFLVPIKWYNDGDTRVKIRDFVGRREFWCGREDGKKDS